MAWPLDTDEVLQGRKRCRPGTNEAVANQKQDDANRILLIWFLCRRVDLLLDDVVDVKTEANWLWAESRERSDPVPTNPRGTDSPTKKKGSIHLTPSIESNRIKLYSLSLSLCV